MNGDLLLYWMSRLGSGSQNKFRDALQELADAENHDSLQWVLHRKLSDLAHVDFFRNTKKWQVRPPILAGLAGQLGVAILCGARSAPLISSLEKAAQEIGSTVAVETPENCPSRLMVSGNAQQLAHIESATGISFVPEYSLHLLANVPPVSQKMRASGPEKGVINWQVNIFDLAALRWIPFTEKLSKPDALPKETAIELKSKYETKYCVTDGKGILRKLPKREAIYAAAFLCSVPLIEYDAHDQLISTPIAAPLPEVYTRIACLCSGELPNIVAGRLTYRNVPPVVGVTLSILAGQRSQALI
jgi:hypothetical protein